MQDRCIVYKKGNKYNGKIKNGRRINDLLQTLSAKEINSQECARILEQEDLFRIVSLVFASDGAQTSLKKIAESEEYAMRVLELAKKALGRVKRIFQAAKSLGDLFNAEEVSVSHAAYDERFHLVKDGKTITTAANNTGHCDSAWLTCIQERENILRM